MRNDLTDITVVLDRSGSMQSCRADAEGGLNSFVQEQCKVAGEALFTLVQFDTEYEFIHKAVPISDVPQYRLVPRGGTALLDAVGRAINETGDRLATMTEEDRPGLVVFVILTDGEENSSHEFTASQIKEMIDQQTNEYQWQFTYLGANQDAFAVGAAIGISAAASASYDTVQTESAFAGVTANVGRMRDSSLAGEVVQNAYTDQERKKMGKG